MTRDYGERKPTLTGEIQSQFGMASSMRYLRSLPSMQIEEVLPSRFDDLLRDLDLAETMSATRRR